MGFAMTDIFDRASDLEQKERESAIASARKPLVSARETGHCLWCNAKLIQGKRWCDSECREDWELEQESRKRHRGRA